MIIQVCYGARVYACSAVCCVRTLHTCALCFTHTHTHGTHHRAPKVRTAASGPQTCPCCCRRSGWWTLALSGSATQRCVCVCVCAVHTALACAWLCVHVGAIKQGIEISPLCRLYTKHTAHNTHRTQTTLRCVWVTSRVSSQPLARCRAALRRRQRCQICSRHTRGRRRRRIPQASRSNPGR